MAHSDSAKWIAQKHLENTTKVINTLTGMYAQNKDVRIIAAKNLIEQYRDDQRKKGKS